MLIKKTQVNKIISCVVLVSISNAFATYSNNQITPLMPRVMGQAAQSSLGVFNAEMMAPIYGNPNGIWYLDGFGGHGTDSSWIGSIGTGFRAIHQDSFMLGAYVFGDRNRTSGKGSFWVMNPGIELMLLHWDFHVNGYFPTASTKQLVKTLGPASAFGINNFIRFQRHSRVDDLFGLYDIVGRGGDAEIGYTLYVGDQRPRLFLGGYHYAPQLVRDITGIQGGIELPVNDHLHFVFQNSYDNVFHNTTSFAVQFIFGGVAQTERHELQERILDPIPRHLGSLPTGAGILSQQKVLNTGQIFELENNIWFFRPGTGSPQLVTFDSCTFENPCIGVDQTVLDGISAISPNAKLYLSPGQYDNRLLGSGYTLRRGQFIFGRTYDYTMLATGTNRALLNDSLFLEGNNNIYNLRINGQSLATVGMTGSMTTLQMGVYVLPIATSDSNIYNSEITSNASTTNAAAVAVDSTLPTTLNIYSSQLFTNIVNTPGLIAVGVGDLLANTVNFIDSSVTTTNISTANTDSISLGLVVNENGIVNVLRSSATVFISNGNLAAGILSNSMFGNAGTININQSIIRSSGNNANVAAVFNQANNTFNISGMINITQSALFATSTNATGITAGVVNGGNGTVNINAVEITATGDNGVVAGINNSATTNFANTNIFINTSGAATGFPTLNSGTLNDNGGNQCFLNGAPVPC